MTSFSKFAVQAQRTFGGLYSNCLLTTGRAVVLCVSAGLSAGTFAAGEVSSVLFELRSATPFRYSVDIQV